MLALRKPTELEPRALEQPAATCENNPILYLQGPYSRNV